MKLLLPLILLFLTACQPKYYIITERDADGRILSMMEMTEYDRAVTKQLEKATLTYDSHPEFRLATLKKAAQHYAPHDAKTFAVYTHSHTVAPLLNSTGTNALAMWCTHEATYLAIVDKQDYTSKYYHTPNGFHLRDCQTGKTYPIVRLLGYPLGQTYWIEGVPGEWHCRVLVFPPLPEHCTTIDIINEPNCVDELVMRLILVLRMTCKRMMGMTIALNTKVSTTMKPISTGWNACIRAMAIPKSRRPCNASIMVCERNLSAIER